MGHDKRMSRIKMVQTDSLDSMAATVVEVSMIVEVSMPVVAAAENMVTVASAVVVLEVTTWVAKVLVAVVWQKWCWKNMYSDGWGWL